MFAWKGLERDYVVGKFMGPLHACTKNQNDDVIAIPFSFLYPLSILSHSLSLFSLPVDCDHGPQ